MKSTITLIAQTNMMTQILYCVRLLRYHTKHGYSNIFKLQQMHLHKSHKSIDVGN